MTTWRSGVFRWLGGLLVLLVAAASTAAVVNHARRNAAEAWASDAQRDQWLHKTIVNPHVAAHAGTMLFRPQHPLSVIDLGVDPVVGMSAFLEPHRRTQFAHSTLETAAQAGRTAELTVALLLQTLVPLLIVVVTASTFADERAQGTLRHLLSLGVPPRTLAIGKVLGATVPILLVLVPVLSIGAFAIGLSAGVDRWRALALLASYAIYAAAWIVLGLMVSARARTAQTALAVLLAGWLCACVLLPKAAFAAVQRYVPIPTAQEFVEQLDAESGEATGFMEHRAAIEKRLLADYRVATAAELPVSTWGVTLYEREVESTKRYNDVFNGLFDRYDRQQSAIDALSTLCPPLAIRTVSMTFAGTDVAHYRHFTDAVERYRYELVQRMNQVAIDSRLYNSRPTFAGGPDQPAFPQGELDAYASVAPFSYEIPSLRWAMAHVVIPVVTLVVWLAGLILLASRAVARIPLD